ncbi:MAG: prolyl-tRNA editing enzyme YbaK/EbsC (Cys-tRNA(Pro) deacylase) [Methylophagaceae bacterium]|jgi:prolyl-tRNA editing enzyme YbaK/EbsC (Cys-tRNA(Pro) deacylase)
MSEFISSPVTDILQQYGFSYDVITIPLTEDKKPVRNLESLLESEGRDPASVVRSLLFKTGSDTFILLAVAGGGRADWATLRKHLDVRKLKMADFGQVEAATGYVVGAVPPIALPDSLTVLLDNNINDYDTVIIGSGVLGYALGLSSQDLKSAMANTAQTGQFIKIES